MRNVLPDSISRALEVAKQISIGSVVLFPELLYSVAGSQAFNSIAAVLADLCCSQLEHRVSIH
jgi:hypothetical protein